MWNGDDQALQIAQRADSGKERLERRWVHVHWDAQRVDGVVPEEASPHAGRADLANRVADNAQQASRAVDERELGYGLLTPCFGSYQPLAEGLDQL